MTGSRRPTERSRLVDGQRRQRLQLVALLFGEFARLVVEHAQCADGVAGGGDERGAGVEAQMRRVHHQAVVGKARILGHVLDFQDLPAADGEVADRGAAIGGTDRETLAGDEVLVFLTDDGDQRHGHVEDLADQLGHPLELGQVDDLEQIQAADQRETFLFGFQRLDHGISPGKTTRSSARNMPYGEAAIGTDTWPSLAKLRARARRGCDRSAACAACLTAGAGLGLRGAGGGCSADGGAGPGRRSIRSHRRFRNRRNWRAAPLS
nr:hypothetical protein [Pseudoxanthomonas winnipegensis]